MNILVTGANGLLGSALIDELCKEHVVYALVRTLPKHRAKKWNIHYIKMDLTSIDVFKMPSNVDAVYYLAQSNRFREFPEGALDMLNINIYAALRLVDWSQKNEVKQFFYTSSGGVYKNTIEPVQESFEINANIKNGFYLDSKLSAEILLRNFSALFETFSIIRPFFMYGPGQNQSMLIPRLINNIIEGNEIVLAGEKGISINPIYIDDAVEAMINLLQTKGESLYNIAGNEVVSIKDLAEKIGEIVKTSPIFKVEDNKQLDLIADTAKMHKNLTVPKISLDEGLFNVYKAMS
jgi:nucleoside-diphosphate-sugar epimerase